MLKRALTAFDSAGLVDWIASFFCLLCGLVTVAIFAARVLRWLRYLI